MLDMLILDKFHCAGRGNVSCSFEIDFDPPTSVSFILSSSSLAENLHLFYDDSICELIRNIVCHYLCNVFIFKVSQAPHGLD